jgi:hypothetical protein
MATRPTKNPRIAFVPSDAVHALVRELSEASGESRAAIVSSLMDDVEPVIRGQLEAFRKIAARPEEARQHIQDLANETTAKIAQAMLDLDEPKQPRKRRTVKNAAP